MSFPCPSVIETVTPGYYETSSTTSGQVVSYNGYSYTYDGNGNILTVSDGTYTISYEYDSANQLIRENNPIYGYTHIWTYDNAGNILSRTEYAFTVGELGTPTKTVTYSYNARTWRDLLRSYDGNSITYDGSGNPISDGTWVYTWKHGRQLVSMQGSSVTWNYTYDANGMRTSRTDGTHTYTYVYNGSQLVAMTVDGNSLYFTYDAMGVPLSVRYNGTAYWFSTNLQGDVIEILDSTGNPVVSYAYDAWGNLLSCTGTMADTLGALNPLRYRGYVYDTETGLYYLESRYYNPQWGRFINADGLITGGIHNNLFQYCINNPVLYADYTGYDAMILVREGMTGHLGALVQDENGDWWHYYWGAGNSDSGSSSSGSSWNGIWCFLSFNVDPAMSFVPYNGDLSLDAINDSNLYAKGYDDSLYLYGDFSSCIDDFRNSKVDKYNLYSNNCSQRTLSILASADTKYKDVLNTASKKLRPTSAFDYVEQHMPKTYELPASATVVVFFFLLYILIFGGNE